MTFDVNSKLYQKYIRSIDKQKVMCIWDSGLGASEEALVDAYIAAHPLNSAHKYGVDFQASGVFDEATCWEDWIKDVSDYMTTHQIEAVCISPNCPQLTPFYFKFSLTTSVAFSHFFGQLPRIANYMESKDYTSFSQYTISEGGTHYSWLSMTLDYAFEKGLSGLNRDGLVDGNVFADEDLITHDGIPRSAFKYSSRFIHPPYLSKKAVFKTEGYGVQALPRWRIGWKKIESGHPVITATDITNMVNNGKVGEKSLKDHSKVSPIIATLRNRVNSINPAQGVQVATFLEGGLGYEQFKFGVYEDLVPDLDSGKLAALDAQSGKYSYFKNQTPIEANTSSKFTHSLKRVADAETPPTNSSTIRYFDDFTVGTGNQGITFTAHNSNTFPIDVFFHYNQMGNFDSGNSGAFYNSESPSTQAFNVLKGGAIFESTSHGHKISPWAIKNGASVAFGSYVEPSAGSVDMYNKTIYEVVTGNSYAVAHLSTVAGGRAIEELWGDGLASPFKKQSYSRKGSTS